MTECIYICGAGHSGSTLLDMLLGSHTQVASLGEVSHLPMDWATNNLCTCGQRVRDCDLWSVVIKEFEKSLNINATKNPYSLNLGPIYAAVGDKNVTEGAYRLRRRLVSALHYLEMSTGSLGLLRPLLKNVHGGLANTLRLYDLVGRELGVNFVVDSSKIYSRAIGLYGIAHHRMKIILLIRDGRAVYYSMRKRNFSRRFSLNAWYLTFRRALPLLERHIDPKDLLVVRYEDLATDAASELMRICAFIGLNYETAMLDFKTKVHHNINGNDMRFSNASEIRPDVSWKTKLSDEECNYFLRHAGWLNEKLGYS